MPAFLITAAVIVIVFAIILNIPVLLEISYGTGRHEGKNKIQLRYSAVKIQLHPAKDDPDKKKNKKKAEKDKKKEKKKYSPEDISQTITNVRDVYNLLRRDIIRLVDYLAKKGVVFKNMELDAEIGTGDACSAGTVYGMINAFVYPILGFLHNTFTINRWRINLVPDFHVRRSDIYVLCILKTKLRYIIRMLWLIAVMCVKAYIKIKSNAREKA
ncbi:MAG: DUF2953 domain-containing protein [Oscillospiraceae bacterium]|nr:DUF2953 domain-containing protein [Oscillospiraceae bacterium]